MKKFISLFLLFSLTGFSQTMPCDAPPTTITVVKPNVLIVLDVTGSMRWRAYWFNDPDRDRYDPSIRYYGYFHPDSIYQYSSQKFTPVGYCNGNYNLNTTNFDVANDKYLGNILNWGTMSRIDVAKKVLAGGYGQPTNQVDKHTLIGQGDGDGWPTPDFRVDTVYRISKPAYMSNKPEEFYIQRRYRKYGNYYYTTIKTYKNNIDVSNMSVYLKMGVIRQIADKDLDGNWDAGEEIPRFALMIFSTSTGNFTLLREFYQTDETPSMEPFLNAINNIVPEGGTNTGNAVLEAIHYIRYCQSHFGAYTYHGTQTKWDPYYRSFGGQNVYPVSCAKSFVILIGDGESNTDTRITTDSHLPSGPWSDNLCSYNNNHRGGTQESWDIDTYDCTDGSGNTDHPADDYAYYGHITDLRQDGNWYLPDKQSINFYSVFSFGTGAGLFKCIAKWGGFIDNNKDNIPQLEEYDKDNNGVPDNYYEAENGQELENGIKKILYEIMATVSSGTATAIVATGTRGEGVGTYAMYYPRKYFGEQYVDWIGMLQGVWVDPFGNLREETEGNLELNLKRDYVIEMQYDTSSSETKIFRYRDVNGDNKELEFVDVVNYDNLRPLFDLGKYLLNISPSNRNIFTFINNNEIDFKTANRNIIKPYLHVSSDGAADTLINYIRGTDYPNLRSRTLPDQRVYKLGDIIFSSPLVVGTPMERYDLLYGDTSYLTFYRKYSLDEKRRSVVYAGANDGMLHCVNIGYYYTDSSKYIAGHVDEGGHPIGKELWAYIPFNLLPHLKWLKDKSYCHVYYVDLKPYPTDAQIFSNDNTHPNGWGTVLISGFRMGGTKYILPSGLILSSGYACIDVTDPESPNVLWEWRIPDTTYSTSYPNVIKVKNKWYLIVGTGPTQFNGWSSKKAKIYVLNLATGDTVKSFTVPESRSAIGDIISVDFDLDYNVDLIYFGTYYDSIGNGFAKDFKGNLYRINTREDSVPSHWSMTKLFGPTRPITEAPAATLDEQGNLWIYFGTGKYFSNDDEADSTQEYFFGIKDLDTSSTVSMSELVNISNVHIYGPDSVLGIPGIKKFSELENYVRNRKGWFRLLPHTAEKSTTRPYIIGGTLLFTTFQPTGDICQSGGLGRLYAVYYITGTAYKIPILPPVTGEYPISQELGPGLPSEPSLYVGPTDEKIYVQSMGTVTTINNIQFVYNPRGGLIMWKRR